jgi:CheY-like chemotaxis protein
MEDQQQKFKILVAEDEKPMAKALELKLQKEGFDAKAVFNGKDAVEEIKTGKYNFVLMDLLMPEMDGFEVLQHLKDNKIQAPPIIVTSNLSQDEDIQKAKDLGAVDFLVKANSSLSDIIQKVRSHLG